MLISKDSKDWLRQSKRVNSLMEAAFGKDMQRKMQEAAEDTASNTKSIKESLEKKKLR